MAFDKNNNSRNRLLKLMDSWSRKKQQKERASNRAAALGKPSGMKPSTFRKFTKLMEQISFFRKKEEDIISKIDRIEQKHRFMRKKKLLKTARFKPAKVFDEDERYANSMRRKKRRSRLWLFLFFLWLLWESGKPQPSVSKARPEPR